MTSELRYIREEELNSNKKIQTFSNLNSQYTILMNKILLFYDNKDNIEQFTSIVKGESQLSLRVIDFFVTNYAREKEVIYQLPDVKNFMVYYSYKSQLKAYSKKQFDPFCRRERIILFTENEEIRTTVGQLNFFRWAIKNNILEYICENYENIEDEMNQFSKKSKSKKRLRSPKKSKGKKPNGKPKEKTLVVGKENGYDLSLSATKKVSKHNVTITVKFN